MAKKTGPTAIPPELPTMKDVGDVPGDLRDRAELVVKLEEDIVYMKEQHKEERKKLLTAMVNRGIHCIPVIVGKWKKRVKLEKEPESFDIKIEDIGLDDGKGEKKAEKAEKAEKPKQELGVL